MAELEGDHEKSQQLQSELDELEERAEQLDKARSQSINSIRLGYTSAETQSGLPLLPWSCYASVIQCDIIQYLMFLFYYNTGIISFLAIYNDTILCTIFCIRERLYAKKTLFFTCYDVALLFWVFCKHVCFSIHE